LEGRDFGRLKDAVETVVNIDQQLRLAAFSWLTDQVRIHGDVLPREILAQGFEFEGQRVPLKCAGIFSKKRMDRCFCMAFRGCT